MMAGDFPGHLQGRSILRQDTADLHRWDAYHHFFGLDTDGERPLALQWLLFTELSRDLRSDGHPVRMQPFPELPYPRRMWAGGRIAWLDWLSPGLHVSRTTTIARAELKSGSAGEFLLASLQHHLNVRSRLFVEERQDIVFLPAAARPGIAPARDPGFEHEWSVSRRFNTVELFRYSALTLNSHRIHYDAAYATAEEGYPALLVQAPLLASSLMHQAARRRPEQAPVSFSYRSVAPTFVDSDIEFMGRREDNVEKLAIVGGDGGLRMTATMSFTPEA